LLVIADESADAATVAADLLSQAEHDASAQVLLVTPSARLRRTRSRAELPGAGPRASTRRAIAEASLAEARLDRRPATWRERDDRQPLRPGAPLACRTKLRTRSCRFVRNAGAVFAGRWRAETFGDYLAGSSHVLPTDGAAAPGAAFSVYTS
jgi:histidinol dehydrogenase